MEWKLWKGDPPEWTTPDWYAERERAPHLEQGGHRERLQMAAKFVTDACTRWRLSTVCDLGAGDGGLLSLLPDSLIAWGYDLQPSNIEGALERGVMVELGNVLEHGIGDRDVSVATEMLEHLVNPHSFVASIYEQSKVLVASSPWNETDEHHYEFHAWAWDMIGYRRMLEEAGWYVFAHERSGPFQVIMGVNVPAMRAEGRMR